MSHLMASIIRKRTISSNKRPWYSRCGYTAARSELITGTRVRVRISGPQVFAADLKRDMTSSRTFRTLGYLVAAMTAVTLLLSLLEPWAVSLRPREAQAGHIPPPTLSAVRPSPWRTLELVLAPQAPGQVTRLPETHVIVRQNGRVETTGLWDASRPLPNNVLRVCAVYQDQPSDEVLRGWLRTCDEASGHFRADIRGIRLKTMSRAAANPVEARILLSIQRRLKAILEGR
jgi:hypothetical protein